jgi:hypothetical protein
MMTATTELPGHFVNRSGFLQADQRSKHRKQTFKFGIITCVANRRVLSVVKNISPTGALIEVDNALEIPDEFTLTIESESAVRACRVAWKKAKQIAVNFNGAPREVTPQRQEQRQIGRQERRLAPRRSLNTPGWIRLDGGFGLRECRIIDVSIAASASAFHSRASFPRLSRCCFQSTAKAIVSAPCGDAPTRSAQNLFKGQVSLSAKSPKRQVS